MINKIRILFFSPTGTGRRIALAIAAEFKQTDVVELSDISYPDCRLNSQPVIPEDEWLILILPVYAQRLPQLAVSYLWTFRGQQTPASVICHYGHVRSGIALGQATFLLRQQGFRVISGAVLPVDHAYNNEQVQILARPDITALISQLQDHLRQVRQLLQTCGDGSIDFHGGPRFNPACLIPQKWLACGTITLPAVRQTRCRQCQACRLACPTGAISNKLEIRADQCIRCLACVRACPQGARSLHFRQPVARWYLRYYGHQAHEPLFRIGKPSS